VHAKDFIVNKGSDWHAIKDILKFFPKSDTVLIFALVVESVDAINLTAFMISAKEKEVFLKFDFVCE
jgi:hypothetical protein